MPAPWKKSYNQPRQHIKKQRHYFAYKGPSSWSYGFPVVMYGCESWTIKKGWALKSWCLWTVVLEKTLASPLHCKKINSVHPKGNQSWVFIEGLMLKLEFQYFGPLMWRANSLKKTLMLGKIDGRRRRGQQRMEGWMASRTQWTWVWGHKESDTTERLNNNKLKKGNGVATIHFGKAQAELIWGKGEWVVSLGHS